MSRTACLGFAISIGFAGATLAQPPKGHFSAGLDGYQEVPSISTTGIGLLFVRLDPQADQAEFVLSYDGLEGGAVGAAHIHLGRKDTNGGVMVFLCGGPKPACPASGTVSGTITAADVLPIEAQGIAAGEFAEFVNALRSRAAYVNVHTATYEGGEIRGNLR